MRMLEELRVSLVPVSTQALRGGCYRRTRRSLRWSGVGHRTEGSPILGETEIWMLGGSPVALPTLLHLIEAGVVQQTQADAPLSAVRPTNTGPLRARWR
jgi:hypothetical protein